MTRRAPSLANRLGRGPADAAARARHNCYLLREPSVSHMLSSTVLEAL